VLARRVRVSATPTVLDLVAGSLAVIEAGLHDAEALEESVVLLTLSV
jgi:hypothetical protein